MTNICLQQHIRKLIHFNRNDLLKPILSQSFSLHWCFQISMQWASRLVRDTWATMRAKCSWNDEQLCSKLFSLKINCFHQNNYRNVKFGRKLIPIKNGLWTLIFKVFWMAVFRNKSRYWSRGAKKHNNTTERRNRQKDGPIDGQLGGRTVGWTDSWMDGHTHL